MNEKNIGVQIKLRDKNVGDGEQGVHLTAIELLMDESKGTVLDVGSGEGAFSQRLIENDFKVVACDLDSKNFKLHGVPFISLDLNKSLDVKREFDYVSCMEVIEHLENPHKLIRDLNKVLKLNGKLIISTPNISNYYSRILFLFTGRFKGFAESDKSYGHINPICFNELKDIIEKNGFLIEQVKVNKPYVYASGIKGLLIKTVGIFLRPFIKIDLDILKQGDCIIIKARKINAILS